MADLYRKRASVSWLDEDGRADATNASSHRSPTRAGANKVVNNKPPTRIISGAISHAPAVTSEPETDRRAGEEGRL